MRWKVALLEDDQFQLKDLKETLSTIPEIEVVAWATNSSDFLTKITDLSINFIIADINLNNDSSSGMQVAHRLKLPVIFASGNNAAYLKDIESLKREHDLLVDHLTKPIREEDLIITVKRFIRDLSIKHSSNQIWLKLGEVREKMDQSDIVFLCTDKNHGALSNNKLIYFRNRKPVVLVDFSFKNMVQSGFDQGRFIQIHKSYYVNKEQILKHNKSNKLVTVEALDERGLTTEFNLPVSTNYRDSLR